MTLSLIYQLEHLTCWYPIFELRESQTGLIRNWNLLEKTEIGKKRKADVSVIFHLHTISQLSSTLGVLSRLSADWGLSRRSIFFFFKDAPEFEGTWYFFLLEKGVSRMGFSFSFFITCHISLDTNVLLFDTIPY